MHSNFQTHKFDFIDTDFDIVMNEYRKSNFLGLGWFSSESTKTIQALLDPTNPTHITDPAKRFTKVVEHIIANPNTTFSSLLTQRIFAIHDANPLARTSVEKPQQSPMVTIHVSAIQKVINRYQNTRSLRQILFGDPEEVTQIKQFAKRFADRESSTLTNNAICELTRIIARNPKSLSFIPEVKTLFADKTPSFFVSASVLDRALLLDSDNLEKLYRQQRYDEFNNLFLNKKDIELINTLTNENFEIYFVLAQYNFTFNQIQNVCVKLKNKEANDINCVLSIIKKRSTIEAKDIDNIITIVDKLKSYLELKEIIQCLGPGAKFDSVVKVLDNLGKEKIFAALEKLGLRIDSEIIKLFIENKCKLDQIKSIQSLAEILKLLSSIQDFNLTSATLALLMNSRSNIQRLKGILTDFAASNLLTPEAISQALEKMSSKLDKVDESKVFKLSKEPRSERSLVQIEHGPTYYTQHRQYKSQQYPDGTFGVVKRGYKSDTAKEPILAIKKYFEKNIGKARKKATREVKYLKLLERVNPFYFFHKDKANNDSAYVVSEWQQGKAMYEYKSQELESIPFKDRVECVISGLNDLNKLHLNFRVHYDLKKENIMLDPARKKMKLIDFDGAHKPGSTKSFTSTFTDPTMGKNPTAGDEFCRDVYIMGGVIAALFPEIYKVSDIIIKEREKNRYTYIIEKQTRKDLTPAERAIIQLVTSMTTPIHSQRSTSEMALNYAQTVLENIATLLDVSSDDKKNASKELLQKLDVILNPKDITIENVLRGRVKGR